MCFIVFTLCTLGIIYAGVRNGIERVSRIMMPILVVLSVVITVYSVTRPGALSGVKYFLIPNPANFSWMTVVAAMGQMFYSLSIAMGILITFGSYMKKDVSIEGSTKNVEIFDTAIAIMAGLMIIPAVFAFSGGDPDTLQAGPALMFITIPKVFASMGMGTAVGVLFFVLVLFAALTSSIALTESAVSTFEDELGWDRHQATVLIGVIMLLVLACVLGVVLSMAAYYDTNLRSGLENRAKTTTDFFSNYIGQSYNEYYQSCIKFAKTFEDKDRLELQFISPGGKIVASSYGKFAGRSPSTPEIQQAIDSQQTRHYKGRNPLTGERILAVSSPMIYTNGEVIGVLRYVTSLRNADLQVLMIALIAVTVGLLFIGSIFFLSSFFIRSILVPVSQINATAKRIAAGSYGVQIPGQYDDEIGELVSTINDMSVKIGQAEKTQTEFISSVSHELRTPLTAISGWGETLLTSENLDAETRRGVVIIAREAKRLTGMVEELLEFTRMQDGRFTLHVETEDILSLIHI